MRVKQCATNFIIGWIGLVDCLFMILTLGMWFPGGIKLYAMWCVKDKALKEVYQSRKN